MPVTLRAYIKDLEVSEVSSATNLPAQTVEMLPIDLIDVLSNVRKVQASPEADAALADSIRSEGVLLPIVVRRHPEREDRYALVFGGRRLRMAEAAGLELIPALVRPLTDREARVAGGIENMVRAPMHAIDQWRFMRDLVAGGTAFPDAAAALGLSERQARRMEVLGRMEPKLLELIEEYESMPGEMQGRIIANAPRATQAKAAKIKDAVGKDYRGGAFVNWNAIAQACQVTRYSRAAALFPHDAMSWDVDLFAEPGEDDEYTTADGATFLRLQEQVLTAQVIDQQKAGKRVTLVDWDATNRAPKVPAGYKRAWGSDPDKPKRIERVFVAIGDTGAVERVVGTDIAAEKAAEKKKAERATKAADAGDDADVEWPDEGIGDDAPPALVETAKPGISKAGMQMIAAAKTEALRTALRPGSRITGDALLPLLALAWCAENVEVRGLLSTADDDGDYAPERRHFGDLAARILTPDGNLTDDDEAINESAKAIMVRVLRLKVDGTTYDPSSGAAAEWIGRFVDAEKELPRFDTEAFLATCNGDVLRKAAESIGEKATGSVKSLRERLIGKMPDWKPDAAVFGAAAPLKD